jgi:DNA primase
VQLARGQASTTISEAKDTRASGRNETFAMIDSVAAVLGLVSAGIFLAHAIESYRAHALVGTEARFTSFKQGRFRRVQ